MPRRKIQSQVASSEAPAKIYLYGEIGESWWDEESLTGKSVVDQLAQLPETAEIEIHVNSVGGDVAEGLAIYNGLKKWKGKKKAYIDGYALSAASFVALAADEVISPASSIWMVHNPATLMFGDAAQMRAAAEMLDTHRDAVLTIYTERTGMSADEIIELLDNETWFTGTEAAEWGFATAVVDEPLKVEQKIPYKVAACFNGHPDKLSKLQSLGWSVADSRPKVAASAARPEVAEKSAVIVATNSKPVAQVEPVPVTDSVLTSPPSIPDQELPTMTDMQSSERITQMSDEIRELKLRLAAAEKTATEASVQMSALNTTVQYWQMRATAVSLYAIENRLTEEEYHLDFSEDPQTDIERLVTMSADDARIEIKTIDRALRRAQMKSPIERVKDVAGQAKLQNTALKSQAVDVIPESPVEQAAPAKTPTGESVEAYAARLVANLKIK